MRMGIITAIAAAGILAWSIAVVGDDGNEEPEKECTCEEQSRSDCEAKGESGCFYEEDCATDSCVEEEEASKKKPAKKGDSK